MKLAELVAPADEAPSAAADARKLAEAARDAVAHEAIQKQWGVLDKERKYVLRIEDTAYGFNLIALGSHGGRPFGARQKAPEVLVSEALRRLWHAMEQPR